MTDSLDRLKTALSDRYSIEEEVGAGGMATVYLAEDLKHDRKVALKVLRPELAAVIGAGRFLTEIKTTAFVLVAAAGESADIGGDGGRDEGEVGKENTKGDGYGKETWEFRVARLHDHRRRRRDRLLRQGPRSGHGAL